MFDWHPQQEFKLALCSASAGSWRGYQENMKRADLFASDNACTFHIANVFLCEPGQCCDIVLRA
jgi:hypothetical protein